MSDNNQFIAAVESNGASSLCPLPSALATPLPAAKVPISIRPATLDDLPAIDALQKKHGKQLGFMNRPTLEGKVKLGQVLVAEATAKDEGRRMKDEKGEGQASAPFSSFCLHPSSFSVAVVSEEGATAEDRSSAERRVDHSMLPTNHSTLTTNHCVGYLIGNDRYKHRDELGVIFQLCVAEPYRRSLVAANLLAAQFERSAYGCKLYCCWCAQDIAANRFWQSMGFVPIAFRAGSEKRSRVHIFWQKRIRRGDATTPWWFPSQTSGGMMDAARIALPIPPGMSWTDDLPRLLPAAPKELKHDEVKVAKKEKRVSSPGVECRPRGSLGGLWFAPAQPVRVERPKPAKTPKVKQNDPRLAAKARELRDRWLEQVNAQPMLAAGKYELSRTIEDQSAAELIEPQKLLAA